MNRQRQLAMLLRLSAMARQADLARLAAAASARDNVRSRIGALDDLVAEARAKAMSDPEPAALQVMEGFARLMTEKRATLNIELARRSADWHAARSVAARSFGRNQALEDLTEENRAEMRAAALRRQGR